MRATGARGRRVWAQVSTFEGSEKATLNLPSSQVVTLHGDGWFNASRRKATMGMKNIESPERRSFLRAAPVAAMAGIGLTELGVFPRPASAQAESDKFEVITAETLQDAIKALQASPGNRTLYECSTFSFVLTSERAKSAKEFEWHEHRDHVFHIIDGSTTYELGGRPQNGHSPKPGEWLAPSSEGVATITLKQGEFLAIPRGTPHRRTTKESVLFALFSPMTAY
jgi:quercetin dioxygenase-like cupin family protein